MRGNVGGVDAWTHGRRWLWASSGALAFVALGAPSRASSPVASAFADTGGVAMAADIGHTTGRIGDAECPEDTVPDDGVCVHLAEMVDDGPLAPELANTHRERSGRVRTYDQIPKLPDRPADYDAYRYPVPPGLPGGRAVVSGYDLDRPDDRQRRGRTLSHVGHGGVDLPQAKGTPVALVALEHQEGKAEVLYTGPLFGTTVVTRHTIREGGRLRDYLVLFGHLDAIAAGVAPGAMLDDGALVGTVGDSGSPELVHLHLEIRRVRDDVDVNRVPAGSRLLSETVSVVSDPRNLLPLK